MIELIHMVFVLLAVCSVIVWIIGFQMGYRAGERDTEKRLRRW